MKTYYIGYVKQGKTLVIQAREDKDTLSPELWIYWGAREITKVELKKVAKKLMENTNFLYHERFERVRVE